MNDFPETDKNRNLKKEKKYLINFIFFALYKMLLYNHKQANIFTKK